jgi:hypothetical protein
MDEIPTRPGGCLLTDCPYCEGEGTDQTSILGLCARCYGTGRTACILAERALARWARFGRPASAGRSRPQVAPADARP